jgi:hypothetical protein
MGVLSADGSLKRWRVTEYQSHIINVRFTILPENLQSVSHDTQLKVSKKCLYAAGNTR